MVQGAPRAEKVPRYVLFVDDLPHTPTHKVSRRS